MLTQLLTVEKFEFKIPKTIFSSAPEDIEDFRLQVGDLVMKPLGYM